MGGNKWDAHRLLSSFKLEIFAHTNTWNLKLWFLTLHVCIFFLAAVENTFGQELRLILYFWGTVVEQNHKSRSTHRSLIELFSVDLLTHVCTLTVILTAFGEHLVCVIQVFPFYLRCCLHYTSVWKYCIFFLYNSVVNYFSNSCFACNIHIICVYLYLAVQKTSCFSLKCVSI